MKEITKNDATRRLARIRGQVDGVQKMIDEERYCVDVVTQVSALRAALDQFGLLMLSMHLETCVYGEEADDLHCKPMTREERQEEIRVTLNRFLK